MQCLTPRDILSLRNGKSFAESMPSNLRMIASMRPLHEGIIGGDEQEALNSLKKSAGSLLNLGPGFVAVIVYRNWASTQGIPGSVYSSADMATHMASLTESQRKNWQWYLDFGEIPKTVVIECAKQLIFMLANLPDIRYVFGQQGFAHTGIGLMLTGQMELANLLLPNLTDEEAKYFFGPKATAQDVRDLNIEKIFNHKPFTAVEFSLTDAIALLQSD